MVRLNRCKQPEQGGTILTDQKPTVTVCGSGSGGLAGLTPDQIIEYANTGSVGS